MPDIPQLVAASDSRLADMAAEISVLDAATAQLAAPRAGGQAPGLTEIVNGICCIVGGILGAVPGWGLRDVPRLADFQNTLGIMPAVLGIGALAGLALKERAPTGAED
jgi:hypothetical protein